jgi:glucose-1-phosphate cytidylyltransferase
LAGGLGSRLSEETHLLPKPMIKIGPYPMIWHIMKIYSAYGLNDFIICLGYKGYIIKEYFINYALHMSDVTMNLQKGELVYHKNKAESWKVTLVETGDKTLTGGRLKRVSSYLKNEKTFCFTYGDGVADINIKELLDFHHNHGCEATITAVRPLGRFGNLALNDSQVTRFQEKVNHQSEEWINGGFFVLNRQALNYIDGDQTVWEHDPMYTLVNKSQLRAYRHRGFWQPMDTLREKHILQELWARGEAPWKVW